MQYNIMLPNYPVVVEYGDLAIGRMFTASSTCGQDGPEVYCNLSNAANTTGDSGNQCFTCDDDIPSEAHPARFLTDSSMVVSRTWWQARNGVDNVTLELEMGALFLFTHLTITFRSPRPAAAVIERSRDFGETYEPYQYYSDDCMGEFGMPDQSSIRAADEVICTSEYSSIEPLTNGEVSKSMKYWISVWVSSHIFTLLCIIKNCVQNMRCIIIRNSCCR